jgi:hypothetical protein
MDQWSMGVVIEEGTNSLILGWYREDGEKIHVFDQDEDKRWKGEGLIETLTTALVDIHRRSN